MGYPWFEPAYENKYFISQLNSNMSKDLWLVGLYWRTSGKYKNANLPITEDIRQLLSDVVTDADDDYIAIPPQIDCPDAEPICNVQILSIRLQSLYIKHHKYITAQYKKEFRRKKSIGELTVYVNDLTKNSKFE